jgi:hypothetical protein
VSDAGSAPIVIVEELVIRFGDVTAVDGVSFGHELGWPWGTVRAASGRKGIGMSNSSGADAAAAFVSLIGGAFLCYFLFIILLLAGMIFVYYKIIEKTGNSGWLALLVLVPFVGLGLIIYLAFSDWPVLRENRDLRARLGYGAPGYGGPGYPPPGGGYAPPVPGYASPPPAPYVGQPPSAFVPPAQPPAPSVPPAQPPLQP